MSIQQAWADFLLNDFCPWPLIGDDMSETSETKIIEALSDEEISAVMYVIEEGYRDSDDDEYHVIKRLVKRSEEAAALSQPAAVCGPGLTEEVVNELKSQSQRFWKEGRNPVLNSQAQSTAQAASNAFGAIYQQAQNLLARDAKADTVITKGEHVEPKMTPDIARDMLTDVPDTVTLRREVVETFLGSANIARKIADRESDRPGIAQAYEDQLCKDSSNYTIAIAEAEAALAKGGEHAEV